MVGGPSPLQRCAGFHPARLWTRVPVPKALLLAFLHSVVTSRPCLVTRSLFGDYQAFHHSPGWFSLRLPFFPWFPFPPALTDQVFPCPLPYPRRDFQLLLPVRLVLCLFPSGSKLQMYIGVASPLSFPLSLICFFYSLPTITNPFMALILGPGRARISHTSDPFLPHRWRPLPPPPCSLTV